MPERTGTGDPVVTVPLLWRRGVKTGRTGLTLDAVVEASIALADAEGLEALSMRKIADRLGVGAMTLYAYVPGRAELIDLMVDQAFGRIEYEEVPADIPSWRNAMEVVAAANWDLLLRHPWLTHIDTSRPPLGPGTIAKYDRELRPLASTGLDDIEVDQALGLVLQHVTSTARQAFATGEALQTQGSDSDWWDSAGPLLAALIDPEVYPYAVRVGDAAGQTYGAAADPERAYTFGLAAILDGIQALVQRRHDDGRLPS